MRAKTLLEAVTEYKNAGASQEEYQAGDYAERTINALSNFEFLTLLSEVLDQPDAFFEGDE